MNVENEEEYFDAIPNLPPIYTGMTSVGKTTSPIFIPLPDAAASSAKYCIKYAVV